MLAKYKSILTIFAVLVLGLLILAPEISVEAESVNKIPDRTVGANGASETPDPPQTSSADVFPPFQVSAGSIITGINYKFNSTQDLTDAFNGAGKKLAIPMVNISIAGNGVAETGATTLVAQPLNFSGTFVDQYFAWCVGSKERRISQNGIVAGGTRIPLDGNGSDCYDDVTRIPSKSDDTDSNADGMGDKWEQRYFGTLSVDPRGDKDQDGFLLDSTNAPVGPDGVIKLVPNSIAGTRNYDTCDGTFQNAEEWVWGTNPIDPDSDDDGYSDEQDVCGKGQLSFGYTPPDGVTQENPEFAEVIADGYSLFKEENGQLQMAKIANSGQTLFISQGQPLDVALDYRIVNLSTEQNQTTQENTNNGKLQKDIYVNDEVEMHAAVGNNQEAEGNLHYQWSFQLLDGGVDDPAHPETVIDSVGPLPSHYGIPDSRLGGRAGYGLNPYRLKIAAAGTDETGTGFHITPKTGNKVVVTVAVNEPSTGKRTEIQQSFPIATSVTLDFEPGLPIQPLYPQADISTAPEYTVTAIAPGLATNDFLYEWYVDEKLQPNSKIGGDSLKFKATKPSGSYKISVVMTRVADEKVFAKVTTKAIVSPLKVSITNCPDYTQGGVVNAPGKSIALNANITAQGTFPGSLEYQWFVNGKPLTDVLTAPQNSVTFIPTQEGAYNISYFIQAVEPTEASAVRFVPFAIEDSCLISVTGSTTVTTAQAFSRLVASAVFAIPSVFRGVLTFGAIIFVIFGIIFLVRNKKHRKT